MVVSDQISSESLSRPAAGKVLKLIPDQSGGVNPVTGDVPSPNFLSKHRHPYLNIPFPASRKFPSWIYKAAESVPAVPPTHWTGARREALRLCAR